MPHMDKHAVIDTRLCRPELCGPCPAVDACPHNLIEQEGPDEVPIIWSESACVGCGRCVSVCTLHAISVKHGT